jgi:Domain of unknown function (DUF6249)
MSGDPYLIGVVFWIFVGAVSIAGIVAEYKRRRINIDLLRFAIEKGHPLDPALVDKLLSQAHDDKGVDPNDLQLGGVITTAAGIGICILALFIAQVAAWALYPIMGAGLLTVCVGIGLLVAARVLRTSQERTRKHSP